MDLRQDHVNVALLTAIGALAKRLTGDHLFVELVDDNGNSIWTDTSAGRIRWEKTTEAASANSAHPLEGC